MINYAEIRELQTAELDPAGLLYKQAGELAGMALTAAGYNEEQAAKLCQELLTAQPKTGTRHFIGAVAGNRLFGLAIVDREGGGGSDEDVSATVQTLAVEEGYRGDWVGVHLIHAARQVGHQSARQQNNLHTTLPKENSSLRVLFSGMNVIVETEPEPLAV
ncbi:MAG: hypothetical protein WAW63_00930 [Candidatus Saccharimonadales bacterium]